MSRRTSPHIYLVSLTLLSTGGCFDLPELLAATSTSTSTSESADEASTDTTETAGEPCGNGEVDGDEECDLGDDNNDNGECTTQCMDAACGDGLVLTGVEECDDTEASADCDADCTFVVCGDGTVNEAAGEDCEDGEVIAGATCVECAVSCDAGRADCDDNIDCEMDIWSDTQNCGGCGLGCADGAECRVGSCGGKLTFVSDAVLDPASMIGADLSLADGVCTAEANAAGFAGTFMVWAAVAVAGLAPDTRFTQSTAPYVRADGQVVASDWADLTDGQLDNAIELNASGGTPELPAGDCWGGTVCATVLTGVTADGALDALNCSDWSDPLQAASFRAGSMTKTNIDWTATNFVPNCNLPARIYCFEQ